MERRRVDPPLLLEAAEVTVDRPLPLTRMLRMYGVPSS